MLADARGGAPWRSRAGVDEPSPELAAALDTLGRATTGSGDGDVTVDHKQVSTWLRSWGGKRERKAPRV